MVHSKKFFKEDLNVSYMEEGGYFSEEEAYEAYGEQLVLFKEKIKLLKEAKPSHGEIKSDGTCNAALKRICNNTGLPVVSMHDLRHYYGIFVKQ